MRKLFKSLSEGKHIILRMNYALLLKILCMYCCACILCMNISNLCINIQECLFSVQVICHNIHQNFINRYWHYLFHQILSVLPLSFPVTLTLPVIVRINITSYRSLFTFFFLNCLGDLYFNLLIKMEGLFIKKYFIRHLKYYCNSKYNYFLQLIRKLFRRKTYYVKNEICIIF